MLKCVLNDSLYKVVIRKQIAQISSKFMDMYTLILVLHVPSVFKIVENVC